MKNTLSIADRLKELSGVDVRDCYQCGKCTAGCPMAEEMDFPPSYLMRLLQTGSEANYRKVLSSRTVWYCLSCEQCIGRCPKEVDIPALMDCLREEAQREGCISPKAKDIVRFHKSFMDCVKNTGRSYELGLVLGYKLRSGHLMQDVQNAPALLAKGKLNILPECVHDMKKIKGIFSRTEKPAHEKE